MCKLEWTTYTHKSELRWNGARLLTLWHDTNEIEFFRRYETLLYTDKVLGPMTPEEARRLTMIEVASMFQDCYNNAISNTVTLVANKNPSLC